jgi:hypothetical protein
MDLIDVVAEFEFRAEHSPSQVMRPNHRAGWIAPALSVWACRALDRL